MDYLSKAKKALEQNRIKGAKALLKEHYLQLDKQEFEAKLRVEYDELFPYYTEHTSFGIEYNIDYMDSINKDIELASDSREYISHEITSYKEVKYRYRLPINYSEDEDYVTFEEYKNETKVITEAIEEVKEVDEDGNEVITQEYVAEVTEPLRPFIKSDYTDLVTDYINSKYTTLRENEYPSIYEFADAWVKDDEVGMQEYKDKCLAVKAKYPKA